MWSAAAGTSALSILVCGPVLSLAGVATIIILFGTCGSGYANLLPCQQAQQGFAGIFATQLSSRKIFQRAWAGSGSICDDVFVDTGKACVRLRAFASIHSISTDGVIVDPAEGNDACLASSCWGTAILYFGCSARRVSVVGNAAVEAGCASISVSLLCEVEVSSTDWFVISGTSCQVP